ncbi:MAG: winged helix-turn-helix domain-containing protein [Proteobacteria bacterium]|nr:winged helix-turn-helix domain-containing protein [Pseudomonadota bacterium]
MPSPEPAAPSWTFLSNHAHVLLCIAQDADVTIRALSDQVGITERAVQRILSELQHAGYVDKQRIGRRDLSCIGRPFHVALEGALTTLRRGAPGPEAISGRASARARAPACRRRTPRA